MSISGLRRDLFKRVCNVTVHNINEMQFMLSLVVSSSTTLLHKL